MEPINCNANDSSRQIDTHTKAKRKQHFSKLSHIHTQSERKKRSKSRASPTHTHTHIDDCYCTFKNPYFHRQADMCVFLHCLGNQFEWKTRIRGHHFVEGGNNENCTHTHTLTDALIKHGSKNKKKVKRNERHHSLDSCIQ